MCVHFVFCSRKNKVFPAGNSSTTLPSVVRRGVGEALTALSRCRAVRELPLLVRASQGGHHDGRGARN